jgi:hypothetical protein
MSTITQQIVGELISHEKYTFVDGKLIYAIVDETIAQYKKLTDLPGQPEEQCLRDKMAIQELRDASHTAYTRSTQSILLSLASAQRIKKILNRRD